ncbi:MAG: flagellar biosynthesis protein FlhB [Caldilineaceae bacterium]|nr:flagellar biosynthesis protein FlhB [Caldilineaceae bacterium]
MSEERTEQPTSRRLEKFREEGRVAKSQELGGILVLFTGVYMLTMVGPQISNNLLAIMRNSFVDISLQRPGGLTLPYLQNTLAHATIEIALAIAPWMGTLLFIAIAANLAQTRGLVQPKLLIPKWDRLNPLNRVKQMFGTQMLVETVKGLAKQFAIGILVYQTITNHLSDLISSAQLGFTQGILGLVDVAYNMALQAAIVLLAIAALDYVWQYTRHRKSLMMTKQEVREESKQQEGSPEVKSRIRRIQREMSRRRMMAQVPDADAVIVNPTHFAVAIRYDNAKMQAPKIVAKGQDDLAMRIISLARRHGVPVVPNKPLARALYKLPLDTVIPPEFFQAVAEVLAFVYGLKNQR